MDEHDVKKKKLNKKKLLYGGGALVTIIIVLAVSVFAVMVSDNFLNRKFDLTSEKIYSISQQSVDVVQSATTDVTIYRLADDQMVYELQDQTQANFYKMVYLLLDDYTKYNSKVNIVIVNPDKQPDVMNELDPDNSRGLNKFDIVFKSGTNVKKVSINDTSIVDSNDNLVIEQILTGALKQVIGGVIPKLYTAAGHGEANMNTASTFTYVKSTFGSLGFDIANLNISLQKAIPDDATMILFLSPKTDLLSDEAYTLGEYMKKGGKVVFMFDPVIPAISFPNFNSVLQKYNIEIQDSVVYEKDANNYVPSSEETLYLKLQGGPLTEVISDMSNMALYFNKALQINLLKNQSPDIQTASWFYTSDKAVAQSLNDTSVSTTGVFPIIMTAQRQFLSTAKPSRIMVTADSDFISDSMIGFTTAQVPTGVLAALVNWVNDEEKPTIEIAGKTMAPDQFSMTQMISNILFVIFIIVVPIIIIVLGVVVWARRRHR
jgi:hypothetical protein